MGPSVKPQIKFHAGGAAALHGQAHRAQAQGSGQMSPTKRREPPSLLDPKTQEEASEPGSGPGETEGVAGGHCLFGPDSGPKC